jgi:hypothetical protein
MSFAAPLGMQIRSSRLLSPRISTQRTLKAKLEEKHIGVAEAVAKLLQQPRVSEPHTDRTLINGPVRNRPHGVPEESASATF